MSPLVSIIVNCFNQGHYLKRSVKSVLSQTHTNIECLIVDDGSTDNTGQVAKELIKHDSRVKYFYKENSGLPASRNFGIQQAQGEWIQCLDADDWIDENKIQAHLNQLRELDASEEIIFYCDYERVFIGGDETIVDRQKNIIGSLTTDEFIQRLLIPDFLVKTPHPALQQAMLMKKSIAKKIAFPEQMKALGDRYFAIDVLMNGAKFVYTPTVGAFYTKHHTNRTNNWHYMKQYYITFYELVLRNYLQLNKLCSPGIDSLIDQSIREYDKQSLDKLLKIAPMPVSLNNNKIKITSKLALYLFYLLRLILPNGLLYEEYRGPRSQKIMAVLNKLRFSGNSN